MIPDREIWQTAKVVVKNFGAVATVQKLLDLEQFVHTGLCKFIAC